ncbi:MAG: hypothetical protein UU87_C0008G0003 [Parcubacteria group bacterium GW2011_GWA2_42_11]|nr:MAG: hypothetical protein UU87_C0008G0003 [Parcubacteria group bacterium GW2011_GWA2_42_11]
MRYMDEKAVEIENRSLLGADSQKPVLKESPLPKGLELLRLLNSDATTFRKRSGFYGYDCFNDRNEQLPFLVRLVKPDENTGMIEKSSGKHLELLGREFVYPLRRTRIFNPLKVEAIRERILADDIFFTKLERQTSAQKTSFDVFVQQLRAGHDPSYPLWEYVVTFHDDTTESPNRHKVITFLERLKSAVDLGWVFDLPPFPNSESQVDSGHNRANARVDREGPVFLDVETIWNANDDPRHELERRSLGLSFDVVLKLLRREVNLDEAFTMIKRGEEGIKKDIQLDILRA